MIFFQGKTPKISEGIKLYILHPEDLQIYSVSIPTNSFIS